MAEHDGATPWPITGRQDELGIIAAALTRASGGVIVSGPAGVGKTRLAAEAARIARSRGLVVGWVRATASSRAIPLGAVAALLDASETAGEGVDLLGRVRRSLAARAAGRRMLLCVDDGHLLDEASAALVHLLVVTGDALVVMTVRAGHAMPDALQALGKDEHCVVVDLEELTPVAMARLLEDVLAAPVDGRSREALWALTRGNPLFLREVVRLGRTDGTLARDDGVWRWRGRLSPGARLADVVGVRVDGLTPVERTVLELVAVAGQLGVDALAPAEADALSRLEDAGLVSRRRDERRSLVEVAHPLHAEAVVAQMAGGRRDALHARLAEDVESRGARRGGDQLRVAVWRLEAGGGGSTLFQQAAAQALAALDPALAERLARAAIRRDGGFGAHLLLGRALAAQGMADESADLLARLIDDAPGDDGRVAAAIGAAGNLFWARGGPDEAGALLEAVGRRVASRSARDRIEAEQVRLLAASGRPAEALATAGPLLARRGVADVVRVRAATGAAEALLTCGRISRALEVVDENLPAARGERHELPQAEVVLLGLRGLALRHAGRLVEATRSSEALYRSMLGRGSALPSAVEGISLASIWLARGRVGTASRLFRESAVLLRDADAVGMRAVALAGVAQAAAQGGDTLASRDAVAELDDTLLGHRAFSVELDLARAWSAASDGERTRAGAILTAAAAEARAGGRSVHAVQALHALARLGGAASAAPDLAVLAEGVEGPFAATAAAHAAALARGDADGLEAVAESLAGIGSVLVSAETWLAAAAAHSRDGREARARAAATRGAHLLRRCEGAAPPTLPDAPAEDLTRREHEIAVLAAAGLSSREIAGRLVISVRTVDNHLLRVYRKLGVSGRRALADLLRERD
ncbi:LuxR C-terminal-related transcriptional regulator [Miltoncostaea oceani]|uniref:LuxR C-terminal-related transcriptional regulator n=1 Tax=Miltoncostaea oceani TaxID=2843216 RepID=UPI001C3C6210|nr:LuxR family transcriptional regulator [Miltoncostaea oceani]